jgi:hypothetical protein
MGVDPITLGVGLQAAGSLYGAYSQNKNQSRAQREQRTAFDKNQSRINGYLTGGEFGSPGEFEGQLLQWIQNQGATGPGTINQERYQPSSYAPNLVDNEGVIGRSNMNAGNDSLMQLLRYDPVFNKRTGWSRARIARRTE